MPEIAIKSSIGIGTPLTKRPSQASNPREPPPKSLPEPDVNLSTHPAKEIEFKLAAKVSRLIELFYSFILTQRVMKGQLRPLNQTFVNLGYPPYSNFSYRWTSSPFKG